MTNHLQCPKCATEIPWQTKMLRGRIRCLSCGASVSPSKAHAVTLLATWFFVLHLVAITVPSHPYFGKAILYLISLALLFAHYVLYVPLVVRSRAS